MRAAGPATPRDRQIFLKNLQKGVDKSGAVSYSIDRKEEVSPMYKEDRTELFS